MSGLILPSYRKHWRTDWKALLMSLRLTSGHLTYTPGGHLALCGGEPPDCCTAGLVTEVTLSGATGHCSAANGTFALTIPVGSCGSKYEEFSLPYAGDRCDPACKTTEPLSTKEVYTSPDSLVITATLQNTDPKVTVDVFIRFAVYHINGSGICEPWGSIYTYGAGTTFTRALCRSGTMAISDGGTGGSCGTPPQYCTGVTFA